MASTGQPAAREKEVNEQMKYLDESVSNLNQTVERLGPSLSEVMSSSNPKVSEDEPIKEICPLANEIREIGYRVDAMAESIRDILNRIEV